MKMPHSGQTGSGWRDPSDLICSSQPGSFRVRVFRAEISWLRGAERHESIKVFRRGRGVHLKQVADGISVVEICRKAGISQATNFNWKKKYNGLLPTEMHSLKLLEDKSAKSRKLVADLSLDRKMLQDVIRQNPQACSQAQVGRCGL